MSNKQDVMRLLGKLKHKERLSLLEKNIFLKRGLISEVKTKKRQGFVLTDKAKRHINLIEEVWGKI